jgi:putative sensory transduction regulator
MAAVDVVDAYVNTLPEGGRRLAHAEWGITVRAEALGGEPLDVGLRMADGLLQAKAIALNAAGDLDPWLLLWWNRQTRLVRFGCTQSRDIWVHADLPAAAVDERGVDRLLGLVTEGAIAVRGYAARSRSRNAR